MSVKAGVNADVYGDWAWGTLCGGKTIQKVVLVIQPRFVQTSFLIKGIMA
jgi:hypothetical protein